MKPVEVGGPYFYNTFWYLVVMWCLYGVSRIMFSMVDESDEVGTDTLFRDSIMRVWRVALCVLTVALILLKWL